MQFGMNLLVIVQVLSALVMIGLVLVQHGKGADMGASFGSGASGSLFGATGSANFLSRSTAACAAVFFASTLAIALISGRVTTAEPAAANSVLDQPAAAVPAPADAAVPAKPAADAAIPAPVQGAKP
jgi:preprotein translocase subunit SecG